MPETSAEIIWTVLGFALLAISVYMVITRIVIPRFGSGRVSNRDRDRVMVRARSILANGSLDDDTRYELLRRLNSLQARRSHVENWGNMVADRETVTELDEICDRVERAAAPRGNGQAGTS